MPVIYSFFSVSLLAYTASAQIWPNTSFPASAYRETSSRPSTSLSEEQYTHSLSFYNTASSTNTETIHTSSSTEDESHHSSFTISSSISRSYDIATIPSSGEVLRSSKDTPSSSSASWIQSTSASYAVSISAASSSARASLPGGSSHNYLSSDSSVSDTLSTSTITSSQNHSISSILILVPSSTVRTSIPLASLHSHLHLSASALAASSSAQHSVLSTSSHSFPSSSNSTSSVFASVKSNLAVASASGYLTASNIYNKPNTTNETDGYACHDALLSWAAKSSLLAVPLTSTVVTITGWLPDTRTAQYGMVDQLTTINGTRRARALNITSTQDYTVVTPWPQVTTIYPSWNSQLIPPQPSCTVNQNVCSSLWQNYAQQIGYKPSQTLWKISKTVNPSLIPTPMCTMEGAATCYTRRVDEGIPRCAFGAGKVQVYYWPETTAKPDMTKIKHNSTQILTEAPRSVVINGGTTVVSPEMAIYFESMRGSSTGAEYVQCANATSLTYRWWNEDLGQHHSTVWVTGPPSHFSSYEKAMNGDTFPTTMMPIFNASKFWDGDPIYNPGGAAEFPDAAITAMMQENASDYSFWASQIASAGDLLTTRAIDPAELVHPGPRAYYLQAFDDGIHQQGCNPSGPHPYCSIIFEQNYSAQLYIPMEIRSLDPEWAFCDPHYRGAVDPPEALTQTSDVFVPVTSTSAGGAALQSPSPVGIPNAPTVTASANAPTDASPPAASPTPDDGIIVPSVKTQQNLNVVPTSSSSSFVVTQIIIPSQVLNSVVNTPQDNTSPVAVGQPSQIAAGQPVNTIVAQPQPSQNAAGQPVNTIAAQQNQPSQNAAGQPVDTNAAQSANTQNQNHQQGQASPAAQAVDDAAPGSPSADSIQSALAPVMAPNIVSASVSGFSVVIGGQTLTPGSATTINGQVVSQLPGGNDVVISAATAGGIATTVQMTSGTSAITIGSQKQALAPVVTPNLVSASLAGSQVVVSGQTLHSGQEITINGQVVSQMPGGNSIAISNPADGRLTLLSVSSSGNTLTIGSQTGAALPMSKVNNDVVIAGTTLHPGSAVTYAGKTISLDSAGSSAYINGVAVPLSADLFSYYTSSGTIYGVTKSPEPLKIGSSTLKPGSAITYSGETISLDKSGATAYMNGKAVPMTSGTASLTAGGIVYAITRSADGKIGGSAISTVATTSGDAKDAKTTNKNGPGLAGYVASGLQPQQPVETHSDAPPKGAASSSRADALLTSIGFAMAMALLFSWYE